MGLFSALIDSTAGEAVVTTSSGNVPTVVQLYTGIKPIQLDDTAKLSGFSAMTYQAVQVGSSLEEELKNRHQNPDLGVWNCRVSRGTDKQALVDNLLAEVGKKAKAFCMAVDLADPSQVEPTISLLQNALVRHLIENPPDSDEKAPTRETATTTLEQLQATEFGKANEDKENTSGNKEVAKINESFKSITTTLMICVQVPPEDVHTTDDAEAYKKKQAQALVIYHLRKFAAALNCSLAFVQAPSPSSRTNASHSPTKDSKQATPPASSTLASQQPVVDIDTLSKWWRDVAEDNKVWETEGDEPMGEEEATPETVVTAAPLYGPGKHQEDLIESVVLRTAHYPGHWDANKDSLWVALPSPQDTVVSESAVQSGDQGWLTQVRESIAAANDLPPPSATPDVSNEEDKQPKEKDAEVTDFFASLLKKP